MAIQETETNKEIVNTHLRDYETRKEAFKNQTRKLMDDFGLNEGHKEVIEQIFKIYL